MSHRRRLLAPVLVLAATVVLGAPARSRADDWVRSVPRARRPPKIDGRLEAEEWRGAAVIDDLRQVEPGDGDLPSERTLVYLLVDRDNLYVGLRCLDSDPAGIRATQVTRDAVLDPDDRVELVFDTFHDRRNAYFFQIGPGGSKGDGLVGGNGTFFSKSWDGIWRGRARVDEEGWSAEIAIPAKTLSMKPGLDVWGFNLRRHIKRKNEVLQWAHPTRQDRLFQIAAAGSIRGMAVLDQGVGLDVVPYLSAKGNRDHAAGRDGSDVEPGADLRYRVTPSLAAALTVNTDFAEAEVDDRVVNLTRFPVFFPEKRDFFLEDSGIFDFGGLDDEIVPFFSRRIGLAQDGTPIAIRAGGKLTGRVGTVNLGLVDVATDRSGGLPGKNLAVVRASVNVLEESQVGLLATRGNPDAPGDNTLAGADFTYRSRRFLGGHNLRLEAFALGTADHPAGEVPQDGYAYGVLADYPNDLVDAFAGYREISEGFEPALGFVQRRGVRHLFGRIEVGPRPDHGPVRRWSVALHPDVYLALDDGRVQSSAVTVTLLELLFDSGDSLEVELTPSEERLTESFEIHEGVVLPAGDYRFDRWSITLESADKRRLAGHVQLSGGTFFDGRRSLWAAGLDLLPARGLAISTELEHNDVSLREGSFSTDLARLRLTVDFTPRISWSSFLQYDDISDSLGVNTRLRWILEPGRDLFIVVNRLFDTAGDIAGDTARPTFGLRPAATEVTLKLSYTLRL